MKDTINKTDKWMRDYRSDILNWYIKGEVDDFDTLEKSAKLKLEALLNNAVREAETEAFIAKLKEQEPVDQQIILGGLIYKYLMEDTNATQIKITLENFSVRNELKGDLQISAKLTQLKQNIKEVK